MNKKILGLGGLGILGIGIILLLVVFPTYTVTFDSKMGTSIPVEEVRKNDYAKKPEDPVMEGYTFLGWYLEDELFDFENTPIKEDITLVGKWQKL